MKSQTKKGVQFTCRIPARLKSKAIKRLKDMGCASLSEYVRLLIINDLEGYEGLIGQTVLDAEK